MKAEATCRVAMNSNGLPKDVPPELLASLETFDAFLDDAVKLRVESIPPPIRDDDARVAVLFSGGIDCTIIAALIHRHLPPNEPVDLLNVAFEQTNQHDVYAVPDRITAMQSLVELQSLLPDRTWRLIEVNVPVDEYQRERNLVVDLMHPNDSVMDLSIAIAFWFASRGVGVTLNADGETVAITTTARVVFSGHVV
jgi:asparagine synthetase B (glutamine-hydrolysing)